jgi:hypothetical protein
VPRADAAGAPAALLVSLDAVLAAAPAPRAFSGAMSGFGGGARGGGAAALLPLPAAACPAALRRVRFFLALCAGSGELLGAPVLLGEAEAAAAASHPLPQPQLPPSSGEGGAEGWRLLGGATRARAIPLPPLLAASLSGRGSLDPSAPGGADVHALL